MCNDPRGSGAGRSGSPGNSRDPHHNRTGREQQGFRDNRYLEECDYALSQIQKAAPRIAAADQPEQLHKKHKHLHPPTALVLSMAKEMLIYQNPIKTRRFRRRYLK